jgi:hypothetical protein
MLSLSVLSQKCRDAIPQCQNLTEDGLHTRHVLAENPNSIQRVRIGNDTPSRQQSVAWFEPNDSCIRGRKPYGAPSIGT